MFSKSPSGFFVLPAVLQGITASHSAAASSHAALSSSAPVRPISSYIAFVAPSPGVPLRKMITPACSVTDAQIVTVVGPGAVGPGAGGEEEAVVLRRVRVVSPAHTQQAADLSAQPSRSS